MRIYNNILEVENQVIIVTSKEITVTTFLHKIRGELLFASSSSQELSPMLRFASSLASHQQSSISMRKMEKQMQMGRESVAKQKKLVFQDGKNINSSGNACSVTVP